MSSWSLSFLFTSLYWLLQLKMFDTLYNIIIIISNLNTRSIYTFFRRPSWVLRSYLTTFSFVAGFSKALSSLFSSLSFLSWGRLDSIMARGYSRCGHNNQTRPIPAYFNHVSAHVDVLILGVVNKQHFVHFHLNLSYWAMYIHAAKSTWYQQIQQ